MARRIVTHSRKHAGRIIAVGNPAEWWSPRSTTDVTVDIDAGAHTYWARHTDRQLARVSLSTDRNTIHAWTSDDRDLLLHLPPC